MWEAWAWWARSPGARAKLGTLLARWSGMSKRLPPGTRTRSVLAIIDNNAAEANGDARGAYFALPEEKETLRKLEKRGEVIIERTGKRDAGFEVWYARRTKVITAAAATIERYRAAPSEEWRSLVDAALAAKSK